MANERNQVPKKDPNFLLIVIMAAIAILLILLASFFTIDWEGKRIVPRAHGSHRHPTSLLLPADSFTRNA